MENQLKLKRTICGMLPYELQMKLSNNVNWHPNGNEKAILKQADATLTPCLYADIELGTYDSLSKFLPLLNSIDKITEPILEGGLIPIEELRKELIKIDGNSGKLEYLGYLDNCHRFKYFNEKPAIQALPFHLVEKLKEWHFNIYDLPKEMYIEKSEIKKS